MVHAESSSARLRWRSLSEGLPQFRGSSAEHRLVHKGGLQPQQIALQSRISAAARTRDHTSSEGQKVTLLLISKGTGSLQIPYQFRLRRIAKLVKELVCYMR